MVTVKQEGQGSNVLLNFLTYSPSDAIAKGISAGLAFMAFCWIVGLGILVAVVALITWVVKKIWFWQSGSRGTRNTQNKWDHHYTKRKNNDWMSQAQRRQYNRYAYTDAPKPKKNKKLKRSKMNGSVYNNPAGEPKWYPTGWVFNEESQLWEPPDYLEKEAVSRWEWDEKKGIWIDRVKKK